MLARMGAYPGYNFHTFVWQLLHFKLPLEIQYIGAYPGVAAYPGVGACLGVGACPGYYGITCMLAMYIYSNSTLYG